jgi:hypothetical protein
MKDADQHRLEDCVAEAGRGTTFIMVERGDPRVCTQKLLCAGLTDVRQRTIGNIVLSAATWRG